VPEEDGRYAGWLRTSMSHCMIGPERDGEDRKVVSQEALVEPSS